MKVALIPCGTTEWDDKGRLLGRVELALNDAGQQKCAQWVEALRPLNMERILHAPDGLATQTAKTLSRQLSIPTKALEDLSEVDIGLWAGLTESELKARYATAHRQLSESPLNVNPPGGEGLSVAAQRVNACIRKQVRKKNGNSAIGVVLRPLAFAMARSALEGRALTDVWESAHRPNEPIVIDCNEAASTGAEE